MPDSQSLQAILNQLNKKHGEGTVILGSQLNFENIPRITSGSLALDVILGGGWPANQWHEVYADFSSGKTAVILKTIAANQALDPDYCVWWLASEHFAPDFAALCGVDLSRVYIHDTNVMEEGFQQILRVAETREVDCIVIDSYPALVALAEEEADIGGSLPGLGARINNQFWRKQGASTQRSLIADERKLTGFVVNQPREKIGTMWGNPETTPGGRGKNFAYFTRVELRRADWIKENDETVGITIKATTRKNKSHRPNRTATWDFYVESVEGHNAGDYDNIKELVDVGIAYNVVVPGGGGMYYYLGEGWKGRSNLVKALRTDEKLQEAVREDILHLVTKGAPTEEKVPEPSPVKKASPKRAKAAQA